MDIGEKIKALRTEQGLTLEAVGDRVGVGKSTVRKWENGQIANMRRDKIALLAKALNVTPGYLMGWEDEDGKKQSLPPQQEKLADGELSETVQALVEEVKTLSDEDAALLLAALQAKRKP